MYTRRSVGGNISSANGVIKSFHNHGYEIDILSDDILPSLDNELKEVKFISLPFSSFRLLFTKISLGKLLNRVFQKIENYIFEKMMLIKLKQLLRNNFYEYSYVRASPHVHILKELIQKYDIKLIVEVNKPLSMGPYNNEDTVKWPENKKNVIIPLAEKIQYDIAKVITVDSSLRAKWILDFVGDYKNKILINHNGVDINIFKPDIRDQEIFDSLKLEPSNIIIGMASSFRWYNDLRELFKIVINSLKDNNNLRFLLISGDRKKAEYIQSFIDKNKLAKFVKLNVEIPFNEMPKILNICDIFLSHFNFHKKWPHNCSIKHLEYLALAKPVVATDVGEVNFAIEDNTNGFLCKEGQVDEYVKAIDRLSKNPILRKKLGLAGRNKAISELTWDKNIQRITKFISSLDLK